MGETRRVIRYVVATAVAGTAFATAGAAWAAGPAAVTPEAPQTVALRYSFDQTVSAPIDESGHAHALTTLSSNGGTVGAVGHDAGRAMTFPAKCKGSGCPRAVLETASADDLNPGRVHFRYGATVLLPANQTTAGQNVLQKGYSATGGQYKLQIDGGAGRPSCALVGTGRSRIHLAQSSVTVADGAWHTVECRRGAKSLTILVDGVPRGTATIPAELSVSNASPLRIGGKGAYRDNDQFHGTVDDVWFSRA